MTSLHTEILIDAPADRVWDALRDVGHPHQRITPGVLTDATFDGQIRTVTFAGGLVARERIIDVDEEHMRVAYAVVDGPFEHHHASMRVVPTGDATSTVIWTTDLLPDEMAPVIEPLVAAGSKAMQDALRS